MLNKRWKGNLRRWAVELILLGMMIVVFATISMATTVPNAICTTIPQDVCADSVPYLVCDPNPQQVCTPGCQGYPWSWDLSYIWQNCQQYVMCPDGSSLWIGGCTNPWVQKTGQCCS